MPDTLYDNIGDKIKKWAKLIFIVEAIGAVITGFVFLIDWGLEDGWWALLIIIFGPVVALVSSWSLYAFGQLVEDTREIRIQNAAINRNIQTLAAPAIQEAKEKTKREVEKKKEQPSKVVVHKWRCDGCGNMRTQSPCEHCGKEK